MLQLLSCLLCLSLISGSTLTNEDRVRVQQVVKQVVSNGTKAVLPQELSFLPDFWTHGRPGRLGPEERDLTCVACEAAVQLVISLWGAGFTTEEIEADLAGLCVLIGLAGALDNEVCRGGIYTYGPILEFVVKNTEPTITGFQICGAVLGSPENPCGDWEEINSWTVDLPDTPKPPVETPVVPAPGTPSNKILHITDLHLDLTYTVGNNAECDLPMCCGNTSGLASSPEAAAGYWGSYLCDIPTWTFRDMLEHIAREHSEELDYIMISGDFPAHDVWLQSRERNLDTIKTVLDLLLELFPTTQVIPALGNHEPYPCNILPGTTSGVANSEFDPDWLLSELSGYFFNWLPAEQIEQFQQSGGAYNFLVRPGFRVIALPSPLCLTYNFALFLDFSDPGNILQWLVGELFNAEEAGERVHILSHVPSGNHECLGAWGREFGRIISRFENTVVGQFNGHTHNDEFAVFYDPEDSSRATNMAFITPSVSTYTGFNAGYRLYEVDAGHPDATYRILDTETFVFDLTAANEAGAEASPSYYKIYSAKSDLEMDSLFPGDFDLLVRRLATEEDLYNKWDNYFNKDGPGENKPKREKLCDLLTSSNIDKSKCDEILGPA